MGRSKWVKGQNGEDKSPKFCAGQLLKEECCRTLLVEVKKRKEELVNQRGKDVIWANDSHSFSFPVQSTWIMRMGNSLRAGVWECLGTWPRTRGSLLTSGASICYTFVLRARIVPSPGQTCCWRTTLSCLTTWATSSTGGTWWGVMVSRWTGVGLTMLHEVEEMGIWRGLVNGQEAGRDREDNVESGFLSTGTYS